jgi:hypothetical protein
MAALRSLRLATALAVGLGLTGVLTGCSDDCGDLRDACSRCSDAQVRRACQDVADASTNASCAGQIEDVRTFCEQF